MKIIKSPALSLPHFIINLIKPYKGFVLLIGITGIIWALFTISTPYMLKLIIDHAVSFNGEKQKLLSELSPYVFAYIVLWLGFCLDMRLLDWVKLKLFPTLREDIMSQMFAYLNQHSHRYFQNNFAGSLINKITDMQSGLIDIISTLDDMYAQILGVSVAVITLLFVHPVFAVILAGWVISFLFITFLFLKPIAKLSHVFAESKTIVVGKMVDSISNIMNVRLFARHKEENRTIYSSIQDAVRKDRAMQGKIIHMRIWWDISIIALLCLNLFILVDMYGKDLVTIGDFTFVITLSISILWNLWYIASQFVSFSEQAGRCKQALSIISQSHEIQDKENAKPLILSRGEIKFHNVTFHYDEGKHLFQNKNVVIHAGEKVGIVGFSGSGKSTFVNLILRLFEVESGEISIDNQNINLIKQDSLREHISLIPQDVVLFHRTLLDNIRFGNPLASDDEIIEVAKRAHCDEFISHLSQGYQSMVGERGIKLSGGERQRIAIARAMLKNAPILILDEATSALDSVTENYIQEALSALMVGKTTIVIAHRLSTLSKMDRIIVLSEGKIIEEGTHEELIAKNGHYAKMWKMQAGGFLPEKES